MNIFAIRRMPISGDWRQPPDRFFGPVDRATKRPRFESNSNITQPKKLLTIIIKRVLIHILSGNVLELIATRIFYEFLNIYKILKILREQNIVKFQRPKITSDTWFQTEKDIPR